MKRIALVASIGLVTVLIFIFLGKSKESTHDEVINPPDEFTPPPPQLAIEMPTEPNKTLIEVSNEPREDSDAKQSPVSSLEQNLNPMKNEQRSRVRQLAQKHLDEMNVDYVGRNVQIEPVEGGIECRFLMPEGIRGGDFIVLLDQSGNEVIDVEIQR